MAEVIYVGKGNDGGLFVRIRIPCILLRLALPSLVTILGLRVMHGSRLLWTNGMLCFSALQQARRIPQATIDSEVTGEPQGVDQLVPPPNGLSKPRTLRIPNIYFPAFLF